MNFNSIKKVCNLLKQSETADSCWVGVQGGSSTAAGHSEEAGFNDAPSSTTSTYYTSQCRTCKVKI